MSVNDAVQHMMNDDPGKFSLEVDQILKAKVADRLNNLKQSMSEPLFADDEDIEVDVDDEELEAEIETDYYIEDDDGEDV